ncbi:hypothetical protein [Algoriphagus marincola]|jgi:hypothetical protein|uniref:hypothetical protein n=1 Tax=Algoriphagus marincola TaxID=264027 RepID=UPI00040E516B|nr:hypothetical protein [Algoriphagus marincola]
MNQQFFHIATINSFHEYRGEGPFDGLSFSLRSDRINLAKNLRLVFKSFPGGIHILSAEPDFLKNEEEKLIIEVIPSSPFFYNFTEFGEEFRPDLRVFHFSIGSRLDGKTSLHGGDFVSSTDAVEVISRKLLRDLPSRIQQGKVRLFDFENEEIDINNFNRFFLSGQADLFYLKEEQGEKQLFYKPAPSMNRNPFGILSIDCGQLYQNYISSDRPFNYSIHFKAKKTIWRYILSDKVYDNFNQLSVIDTQNSNFQFIESEFEIQVDRKVKSFETETPLPLLESVLPKFQLVERVNGGQALKVVIKQLPKASPEVLHRKAPNDDTIVSHIFI